MSTTDLTLKSADGTDRVNITAGSLSMVANNAKILDIGVGEVFLEKYKKKYKIN